MRAKRSKKYRKLMHQYELTFGFREPYQVLVDSNFLRAVYSFKMDLIPALERTMQGKVKPLLTKCSLAAIMADCPTNTRTDKPVRPTHLPPPTVLPLRHCSHNPQSTPIDEVSCLLSLLSPSADAKRNKEHYTLATADPPASDDKDAADMKKRKRRDEGQDPLRRAQALRSGARSIPGVPVIYVKRSVMILEPMSTPSENVRDGVERGKLKTGVEAVPITGKRKREDEEGERRDRGLKRAKEPNPLSMKKPKKKANEDPAKQGLKQKKQQEGGHGGDDDGEGTVTKRRKRRHKSAKSDGNTAEGAREAHAGTAAAPVEAGE